MTLLTAIFYGLTWSERYKAVLEVRLGDVLICTIHRGELLAGDVVLSLEDVIARSNAILDEQPRGRDGDRSRPSPVFDVAER